MDNILIWNFQYETKKYFSGKKVKKTAIVQICLYDVLCQDPLNINNRPYITTIWWLLFFNGKLLHIFVTKHLPGQLYDILRICVEVLDYPIWVTMGIHRGWVFVFILFLDLHKNILTQFFSLWNFLVVDKKSSLSIYCIHVI